MNSSGVFGIDAPAVMFFVYFFNGGIILSLIGLGLGAVLLCRRGQRQAGGRALALCSLPAIWFFVVGKIGSAFEQNPPQLVSAMLTLGILGAALVSPIYAVLALRLQRREVA